MLELNKIYQGNCFDYLKEIPDKYFDLLLTDPPYGFMGSVQREVEIGGRGPFRGVEIGGRGIIEPKIYPYIDWDISLTQENINELLRVSKNQIIFGYEHLSQLLPKSRGIYCWDKKRPEGVTYSDFELIWTSFNKPSKFIRFLWNGLMRENVDVIPDIREHPTQKPIEIIRRLLKTHSNENDLILDPFMGSGTTAVACKQLNRNFLGFEISKEYCDIANKRLQQDNLLKFSEGSIEGSINHG